MRRGVSPLVLLLLVLAGAAVPALPAGAAAVPPSCRTVDPYLAAGDRAAKDEKVEGPAAFAAFRKAIGTAARQAGVKTLAGQLAALEPGKPVAAESADLAACLLRHWVRVRYGQRMVDDLREMVGFRTFAETGRENWQAPEFLRQRDWLRGRAEAMGFAFKSYDGRMEEITFAGPEPILALLTHGDVQAVEGQAWSSPPWEGRLLPDGKIVGRGTEDDKGPIVAILYSMAAVRDAGWPLSSTLRLLIANAEESSWQEIPYYLERAPMPDMTFGVDATYPVTFAQKGWGLLSFRAPLEQGTEPPAARWRIERVTGGVAPSIIPGEAEALVAPSGNGQGGTDAEAELRRLAEAWAAAHPPARLQVGREGDLLKVTSRGRSGHSAWPENAQNALTALTTFLSTLQPRLDPWGALISFLGSTIGLETDGSSMGIAHFDPAMGRLTATLNVMGVNDDGEPFARVNIRPPQGVTVEGVRERVAERVDAFERRTNYLLSGEVQIPNLPHVAPVEGKLVSTLLGVWKEVTGQKGEPVAVSGGTQARLFKGGVDFGPALSMDVYRGHGPDEYLTVAELHR
ncbi:MAG TPA: Sapep family Mn(2+)-dependent dipeptidase, partial [Thermoanaerobaculia bacterium]|nr:Sapep family Mn(2+)-dependent dipeptidase [Thermoanaerobaculia bacterium]